MNEERKRAAALLAVFSLLAGCAVLLDFPSEGSEADAASCADDADNDLDGRIDCADPECDAFCPEESPAEGACTPETAITCFDGRDNDRDGLADHHDPGCWPCTTPRLDRCASIAGIDDYEPAFESSDWTTDDVVFSEGTMAAAPGVGRASATMTQLLSGGLDLFEIEGEVFIDGRALTVLCVHGADEGEGHFFPPCEQLTVAGGFSGVQLIIGSHDSLDDPVLLITRDQVRDPGTLELIPARWHPFRLVVRDGQIYVDIGTLTLVVPQPRAWTDAVPLRFSWGAWPFGGRAPALRGLRFRRPSHHPCDRRVPEMAEPMRAISPRSVATDGGRMCALTGRIPFGTREFLGLTAFVSDNEGARWSRRETRLPPTLSAELVLSASVIWDPTTALFRAVLTFDDGDPWPLIMTSPDCSAWDALGSLEPPEGHTSWGDAVVSYDIDRETGEHEVVVLPASTFSLPLSLPLVGRSPDGTPEGFTWTQPPALNLDPGLSSPEFARLQHLGQNLVLTRLGARGGSEMLVSGSDGWRVVPGWNLRASGEVGTFDRSDVFPGVAFLPLGPGQLRVFYAGDGDFSCWDEADPCPCGGDCVGGTGTATMTIGSP